VKELNTQQKCSKYFTYADLINCGETLTRNPNLNNNPVNEETLKAIEKLCSKILDPVQDKYGKIILTYGFASNNLTRKIKKNIYPKLDQHSGYEKNRKGEYICQRLGLACDFYIHNIKMAEVSRYIINNLPFDRLYFYGENKPIHVSYGPNHQQQIIKMIPYKDRKVPRIVKKENF
jgi:hypothetical protein